jgi:hypothetical protein
MTYYLLDNLPIGLIFLLKLNEFSVLSSLLFLLIYFKLSLFGYATWEQLCYLKHMYIGVDFRKEVLR